MQEFAEWFANNPWVFFVGAAIAASVCILLEIFVFRKKRLNKIYNESSSDYEYYTNVRKSDMKIMITYGAALGLPSLVFFVLLFFTNTIDSVVYTIFLVYFLIVTVVLAILRRDILLLILWAIPTLTLFFHAHRSVDAGTYDVNVDSNGHVSVTEHFSFLTILLGMLGIMLFCFKIIIIAVYMTMIAMANTVLSLIGYPIYYMVCIIKTSKEINAR